MPVFKLQSHSNAFLFHKDPVVCAQNLTDLDLRIYPMKTASLMNAMFKAVSRKVLTTSTDTLYSVAVISRCPSFFVKYFDALLDEYEYRFKSKHPINFMQDKFRQTYGFKQNSQAGQLEDLLTRTTIVENFNVFVTHKNKPKHKADPYFDRAGQVILRQIDIRKIDVFETHKFNYINQKEYIKITGRDTPDWYAKYHKEKAPLPPPDNETIPDYAPESY